MNPKFKEIVERCGTHIEPLNMDVTWKEIDFLCEQIVKECANICEEHPGFSGRTLSDLILRHFEVKS